MHSQPGYDFLLSGGACHLEGDPTLREAAIVAWGGVLAQAALVVVTLIVRGILHVVALGVLDGVFDTLIMSYLILIGINLLPIHPLDGATAWRLFKR